MANSVDPDETTHYDSSHLDLHCLQRYLYWSAGMEELMSLSKILQSCPFYSAASQQHSFVEIDHKIFSSVILSLLRIQDGYL